MDLHIATMENYGIKIKTYKIMISMKIQKMPSHGQESTFLVSSLVYTRQGCHFANGAGILLHQPLFNTGVVIVMPTIQLPKIISLSIFLLQSVSGDGRQIKRNS
jgi:hypothetical protein